ncbi:hypothetical protein BaRGS_00023186, partial [Batillaria attramentaria]
MKLSGTTNDLCIMRVLQSTLAHDQTRLCKAVGYARFLEAAVQKNLDKASVHSVPAFTTQRGPFQT